MRYYKVIDKDTREVFYTPEIYVEKYIDHNSYVVEYSHDGEF